MPFGSRAQIYPGPVPLSEIVLDELSSCVKHAIAGVVEGSNKASEYRRVETGELQGKVESRDRKLLVAGKFPETIQLAILMYSSV